jgi:hypothetical protein
MLGGFFLFSVFISFFFILSVRADFFVRDAFVSQLKYESSKENTVTHLSSGVVRQCAYFRVPHESVNSFTACNFLSRLHFPALPSTMGNDQQRMKYGKTLTESNITELSALSGFTPVQVREWHAGFLVSIFD